MRTELVAAGRAVARDSLGMLRRPSMQRNLRQALDSEPRPLKVNVGGGPVHLPGWINTDITWRSKNYLDLSKPWPVPPGTVDFVYGDNVIEHLPLSVGRQALRHIRQALKPGGVLRLVTPDAEAHVRAYLDRSPLAEAHLERHRRMGYEDMKHPIDLLRYVFTEHGHADGYIFDEPTLRQELADAGFVDITRCRVGESRHEELAGLESRAEATDVEVQMALEATAPA